MIKLSSYIMGRGTDILRNKHLLSVDLEQKSLSPSFVSVTWLLISLVVDLS